MSFLMTINVTQSECQHHKLEGVIIRIDFNSLDLIIYLSMASSIYMISTLIAINDYFGGFVMMALNLVY